MNTQKTIPVIPPLPDSDPNIDSNPIVAICGECGREIRRVEMYTCLDVRCPVAQRPLY